MKEYRVDFFQKGTHITNYFDDLTSAEKAGKEGKRDGFKSFLLKRVFENAYAIVKEF